MRKTVSLFLLLCMLFSLFSVMAAAAPEADPITTDETTQAQLDAAVNDTPFSDVKSVFNSSFYVTANPDAGLKSKVVVLFNRLGTSGTLYLPGSVDPSQLFFSWDNSGITVSRNGVKYSSGNAPVAPSGKSVTYKVSKGLAFSLVTVKTVQGSEDVEAMFLELDEALGTIDAMNSDPDHETSCFGNVLFDGMTKPISIKGRGNSTWSAEKKPYNITIYKNDSYEKKANAELISGVKAKKWSLLANHLDNSLMRNKIAMDLANALGIGLNARFVDLWMNGEYLGNYLMTPKNDYQAPDGGYALENDNYLDDEDPQFLIPGMYEIGAPIHDDGYYNRMTVKDIGDDAADAGIGAAEIETYFNEAWAALEDFSSENYQNYFDMDSWAKMFLMYEVSKTYDCFAGSLLMHRDGLTADDKLIAGPAWDYDVSFGRTLHKFLVGVAENIQLNAEGWYNDSIGLMAVDKPVSMLQELGKHASFMQHVAKVYNENKAVFEGIPANVDQQKEILRDSALMNNVLWGTHHLCAEYLIAPTTMHLLGTGKYALNYHITLDWDAYVYNLREYASKRVTWLSDHLYEAAAPAGEILNDGTTLTVSLTAGTDSNTYQWQRSEDGSIWENISGANAAQLTVSDGAQYRCIVANAGAEIWTQHGGKVPTYTTTILTAPAAANAPAPEEAYAALPYHYYTYLGDSISWGYGLEDAGDSHDPYNVGRRVEGSFTDLVADVLEQNNGAEIHAAASSGARLCDFRVLLEQGMGVENPYTVEDDWYGNRHPERSERLRAMGPEICEYLRNSDLVTIQLGINDLTAVLVNSLYATGLVDLNKLSEISDFDSAMSYLQFALGNLKDSPDVLGNLVREFNSEVEGIRANAMEIVKDVKTLAPDADVLLIGYHKAVQGIRVLPGTDFSPIFDLADAALVSLNDYFNTVAANFDGVYYVDAPDASVFYDDGTSLLSILKNIDGFLKNVHPDAEGHAYIANCILDKLMQINSTACRHTHTESYGTKTLPDGSTYEQVVMCADCGKVISLGQLVTSDGTTYVAPSYTLRNAVDTVRNAVFQTVNRFSGGLIGKLAP